MTLLSIFCSIAVLAVLFAAAWRVVIACAKRSSQDPVARSQNIQRRSDTEKGTWGYLLLAVVALAIMLFRPHEDTFTALDHSAYRLMASAFTEGRGFNQPDNVLLEVPQECRGDFLLLPNMYERNTRDRSFLIKNMDKCETEPFFYPLLPLCAAGLDKLVPGNAIDYFVPLCGLLFAVSYLAVGCRTGGMSGLLIAVILFVGSPLPLWLFRGFYVESIGAILVCLPVLEWLSSSGRISRISYMALGLAVSFHPVMVVVSVPVLILFLMTPAEGRKGCVSGLAAYALGVLPLILMTAYICAPYGQLGLTNLIFNFKVSASHRIATIFGAGAAVALLVMISAKPLWLGLFNKIRSGKSAWVAAVVLAALPLTIALVVWSEKQKVIGGLHELYSGLQLPFALLLSVAGAVAFIKGGTRARLLLLTALIVLPVFAYLKGAETMGLWSQRRLIPFYLLLITAVLPSAGRFLAGIELKALKTALLIIAVGSGLSNIVRWPAPYFVRVDHGATAFVEAFKEKAGGKLVFFDYHTFSNPFAVDGKTRALGLCERRKDKIGEVMSWLSKRASTEPVMIATAYSNPGIEDGVRLEQASVETVKLPRVRSKASLPAEKEKQKLTMTMLKVNRLQAGDAPPVLDKIFDGGPMALRGNWLEKPIRIADGTVSVDGYWIRNGMVVIGPLPKPGGKVRVTLSATAARKSADAIQKIKINTPWQSEPVVLDVPNKYGEYSVEITRPAGEDNATVTGSYTFTSDIPYDPAVDGIRGFPGDLLALVHRIRIEAM